MGHKLVRCLNFIYTAAAWILSLIWSLIESFKQLQRSDDDHRGYHKKYVLRASVFEFNTLTFNGDHSFRVWNFKPLEFVSPFKISPTRRSLAGKLKLPLQRIIIFESLVQRTNDIVSLPINQSPEQSLWLNCHCLERNVKDAERIKKEVSNWKVPNFRSDKLSGIILKSWKMFGSF